MSKGFVGVLGCLAVIAGCAADVEDAASAAAGGGGAGASGTGTGTGSGSGAGAGGAASSSGSGAGTPEDRPWCGYELDWSALAGQCPDGCLAGVLPGGAPFVLFDPSGAMPGSMLRVLPQGERDVIVVEAVSALTGSFGGVVSVPKDGSAPVLLESYDDPYGDQVGSNVVFGGRYAFYATAHYGDAGVDAAWKILRAPLDGSAPPTTLATLDAETRAVALHAVEGALAVVTDRGIFRVDATNGGKTKLTDDDALSSTSGDGYVFYATRAFDGIYRVSIASGAAVKISSLAPYGYAFDEASRTLAVVAPGSATRLDEDGAVLDQIDVDAPSPSDAVVDGARVYFDATCKLIPDGRVIGTAYVDFATRETGWTGAEAGFPFVAHGDATNPLWSATAIYDYVVQ